jgi:hypothetical protein
VTVTEERKLPPLATPELVKMLKGSWQKSASSERQSKSK